ncbi:MAG: 5-dehydro-2-deoxygluconokinase [Hyphomicrobiales bacterium]|nr:5-dehydro-2-deoxygluconokinase [Hyphomicrobiales bacterium]
MSIQSKIAQNSFIILGRAGMDFYPDPPGTKTEEATHFFACLGGSSANIAVAITRHGGKTAIVTRVSDDAIGRYSVNELNKYGVDTTMVHVEGGEARNSLAVVESRVEDHQSVIYRNGAADFQMNLEDVKAINYSAYGALITTGTVFAAEPSTSAGFLALENAKDAGLPVIFDIDYRPYSWPSAEVATDVYSRVGRLCDIVIGNDDEFGFMAGGKEKGLDFARELAKSTASIIVYKMGEFGSITITPDEEFETGIYQVTALKPTGAGDAFMGGFIASLADRYSLQDCVLRGSASAAIVVSKVGCAPAMPTTSELNKFLEQHPGPSGIKET